MPTAEITCPGRSYTSQDRSRRVTKVNVPRNTPLGPIQCGPRSHLMILAPRAEHPVLAGQDGQAVIWPGLP